MPFKAYQEPPRADLHAVWREEKKTSPYPIGLVTSNSITPCTPHPHPSLSFGIYGISPFR